MGSHVRVQTPLGRQMCAVEACFHQLVDIHTRCVAECMLPDLQR